MKKLFAVMGIACFLLVGCGSSAGSLWGYENDPYEDEYRMTEKEQLEEHISELESKIEDLKAEIDEYKNGDGWTEDERTQELYGVIWDLEEFLYNEGYDLDWYLFVPEQ